MISEKEISERIRQIIIELIKQNKIIVHVQYNDEDKLVDYSNIKEYENDIKHNMCLVWISRKYLHHFIPYNCVDYVVKNMVLNPRQYIFIKNNKVYDINISNHSMKQFIRRLYYVVNDDFLNHGICSSVKTMYKHHENIITEMLNINAFNNQVVIDMILELLSISSTKPIKYYSKILKRRNPATRYFVHPFSFVIVNGNIVTVELYSQALDVRRANAITSNDNKWQIWFNNQKAN